MIAQSFTSWARRISVACGVAALLLLALVSENGRSERVAVLALSAIGIATALGWLQLLTGRRARPSIPDEVQGQRPKIWWLATATVALTAGLAVQTWFRPGTTVAAGDIALPEGTAWIGRLFEPWIGSNLGEPSQLPLLLPWAAMVGAIHALGGDPALAQRIWYTALFVGAGLGAFALVAALRMGPSAALAGAAVYLFNPFVVSEVNINPVYLAALCLLAAVPAVLVAAGTGHMSVRWGALLVAVAAPLFGYLDLNPPLVGMVLDAMLATPIVVGWIEGREAAFRSLRTLALATPLLLAGSAYWLVPAILHLPGVGSDQLARLSSWSWTESRATIRNAFWVNTIWTWRFPEYNPYAIAYDSFPLSLLRFVLPAIAFSALALGPAHSLRRHASSQSYRALRIAVAAATGAAVIIFLSTGTNPPGSLAFDALYGLPFGWLLREPGRFLMAVGLAYAVLVAIVVENLLTDGSISGFRVLRRGSSRVFRASVAPVALATALSLGFPLYTGAVVPDTGHTLPSAHVTMPSYWNEMARFVDALPTQGALLVMPPDDFYAMPYTWGYYGSDAFVPNLFHRPVVVPNGQGYSPTSPELLSAVSLTARSILDHDWQRVDALTTALNTPLILVRRDITSPYPARTILSPRDLAGALRTAPGAILIHRIGLLELFALTHATAETELVTRFVTVNTRVPDLRLLSLFPPNTSLVSRGVLDGIPTVDQAPPLELWEYTSDSLVWQPSATPGITYRIAELGSKTVVALDHAGTFTAGLSQAHVVYSPSAANNPITVSVKGRPTVSNGDFINGPWGPVGDCDAVLPPPRTYLGANVIDNGAPGGLPSLRLHASADSACESQLLDWHGGALLVSLMIHPVEGSPPRMCLWESGPERCAPLPGLPETTGWSMFRAALNPDPGTTAISIFLYADVNAPDSRTVNEYANVRVAELPVIPSFALLATPTGQSPPAVQLEVLHNNFSSQWQGSIGREHVLVDGMLNGWLILSGSGPAFFAYYRPSGAYGAADWISLVALLVVLALVGWQRTTRWTRRREGRSSAQVN